MLGNARGGVKLNIFGGARSAPRFFIPFWVEKLGLGGGGITPPREPRGGYYPFYPPTSYGLLIFMFNRKEERRLQNISD